MLHTEAHGFPLTEGEDGDVLALDLDIRPAEVEECGDESEARSVDDVAVVVEDVDVGAEGEALASGDDAEGFRIQGAGAADGFLQDAR